MKRIHIAAGFDFSPQEVEGLIEFLSACKDDAVEKDDMAVALTLSRIIKFMSAAHSATWPEESTLRPVDEPV